MENKIPIEHRPVSVINNPEIERTIVFSDPHGDIDGLILDLLIANVIEKPSFNWEEVDFDKEELLYTDYNEEKYSKNKNLGYTWCGRNTHVVIVGDLIDNYKNTCPAYRNNSGFSKLPGEYPQGEAKLIAFVNAIDAQARSVGGRIIKLAGNHELENIKGVKGTADRYTTSYARSNEVYIKESNFKSVNRNVFFSKMSLRQPAEQPAEQSDEQPSSQLVAMSEGAKLLTMGGISVAVIVNGFFFVHGSIGNNMIKYLEKVQSTLNARDIYSLGYNALEYLNMDFTNFILNLPQFFPNEFSEFLTSESIGASSADFSVAEGSLWNRSTDRQPNLITRNRMCGLLETKLAAVCRNIPNACANTPNGLKLVVGHCVQYVNDKNVTYTYKFEASEHHREKYGVVLVSNHNLGSMNRRPSITADCHDFGPPILYRVDVSISRGNNYGYSSYICGGDVNHFFVSLFNYLYSSLPQVMEIKQENVSVYVANPRYAHIHQPRDWHRFVDCSRVTGINTTMEDILLNPELPQLLDEMRIRIGDNVTNLMNPELQEYVGSRLRDMVSRHKDGIMERATILEGKRNSIDEYAKEKIKLETAVRNKSILPPYVGVGGYDKHYHKYIKYKNKYINAKTF